MLDVATRQATAAHEPVTGSAWPAALNHQRAHAIAQRKLPSNHRRMADREAMRLLPLDLNARACAIRVASQHRDCIHQPVNRRASQQVVLPAQVEIILNVRAAGCACPLLCFRQRAFPCFIEFAQRFFSSWTVDVIMPARFVSA